MFVSQYCENRLNGKVKTCEGCLERKHSLFSELKPPELTRLNKNRYYVSYEPGEVICKEGTKPPGLICLNKGKVKISRRGINGNEQIITLKKPVDFIGFNALMGDSFYLVSAIALEKSTVCIIDKNDFFEVIGKCNDLAFKIIRFFTQEWNVVENRLLNLTQKHLHARMADALLYVFDIYGNRADHNTLGVELKRSELAALSNMTTANAIRVLSSFTKEKLIEVNGRDIRINDLNKLKSISVLDN